ncbi:MAG: hypothetical protein COU08_01070 [Candidatus Harrisonbacteria bacterium CG10_big_fil_rev_8_21_14_0_10_42_17]|uniref:UDP-N-acetylmuramoyl-L-alanyl-D-glutamate--2, 6-diaminopimelate ligase n=1 Tax=Candidatus Harrisonbacteria bacterium CG10_big_fil_rev_8_21_14_0_10_42_17 TaxID=1974584 RepID=A0A2M6WIW6_9BACT|nr:MAG: hypothetical protein COU08_01070 [Candidatus Harrisonbacteria bacterium CG10_big_fil_rev_8_21_14_0_10_42_17]
MQFLKNSYHYLLSFFSFLFYRNPSRDIFVIGITGTKGKTTCVEVLNTILNAAEKKTAVLSSISISIGKNTYPNTTETTMPGRFFIKRFLRRAVRERCEYVIIEVTSQGILQHRHRFIDWDAIIFLNLQPEHLEVHGGLERYRAAKVSFFSYAARHSPHPLFFINQDDEHKEYFIHAIHGVGKTLFFSGHDVIVRGWLDTAFNRVHAAAVRAFLLSQRFPESFITEQLNAFPGLPGRMEVLPVLVTTPAGEPQAFKVVIDYAHTPDSLEALYKELKPQARNLICVVSATGGGRDRWKRPHMGRIASEYCSKILLTDEDSYDENLHQILSEIKTGISDSQFPISNIYEIIDRKEAIRKAISLAREGDIVVTIGKGSERWIHIKQKKKIPWNERECVQSILSTMQSS